MGASSEEALTIFKFNADRLGSRAGGPLIGKELEPRAICHRFTGVAGNIKSDTTPPEGLNACHGNIQHPGTGFDRSRGNTPEFCVGGDHPGKFVADLHRQDRLLVLIESFSLHLADNDSADEDRRAFIDCGNFLGVERERQPFLDRAGIGRCQPLKMVSRV